MKKLMVRLLSIFYILFLTSRLFAAGPGTTAANFLKLGLGARPMGMGGAFCAVADDANALYWNPAGLSNMGNYKEISFMHNDITEGIRHEFLSFALPVESLNGSLGASYSYLTINDIQGYDANGAMTNKLAVSDSALQLGYSRKLRQHLMMGIALKSISEQLDSYTANAYAVDLGLLYKLDYLNTGHLNKLSLGFSLQNLGAAMKFIEDSNPLPLNSKLGIAYKNTLIGNSLMLAVDYNQPMDNSAYFDLGAEYTIYDLFSLRMGYQSKDDLSSGLRTGFGLRVKSFDIDYAFQPYGDFGQSHRLSLTFRFGMKYEDILAVKKIDDVYEKALKYYERGDMISAYREFKAVLSVAPGHKMAQEYLAKTGLRIEEIEMNKNIEEHCALGKECFDKNNLTEAQMEFESVIAVNAEHQEANAYLKKIKENLQYIINSLFKRGEVYYYGGDYLSAINEMNKVLTFDPAHAKAHEFINLSNEKILRLAELKQQQQAKESKRKAELQANRLFAQAIELFEANNKKESITKLQQALAVYPDYKEAQDYLLKVKKDLGDENFNLGRKIYEKNDLEKALKYLEEAMRYNPEHAEARQLAKEINLRRNKERQVKAEEYNRQAIVAYSQGNLKEAVRLWADALELIPEFEEAKTNLKRAQKDLEKK